MLSAQVITVFMKDAFEVFLWNELYAKTQTLIRTDAV